MSMTTQFHAVFAEVDVNSDSIIDEQDLRNYALRKGLKEDVFVNKWLRLFDDDEDGIIHEEDFRVKLGMTPRSEEPAEEIVVSKVTKVQHSAPQKKSVSRPRILKADMKDDLQDEIVNTVMAHSGDTIAKDMRVWDLEQHLNDKHRGLWHVKLNPTTVDVKNIKYDKDGMMHLGYLEEGVEMLIWRNDPRKSAPLCCCFC